MDNSFFIISRKKFIDEKCHGAVCVRNDFGNQVQKDYDFYYLGLFT